jgi:uncharacterized protein (TIGR03435 family)
MKWAASAILACCAAILGQSVPRGLTFEAATIKEVDPASVPASILGVIAFNGGPGTKDPERIDYSPVTLRMLLARAYGLPVARVAGPASLDYKRYSLTAVLPPKSTAEQLRQMLKALLTERFDLRAHLESRRAPVYLLTVKNAAKLKPGKEISLDTDAVQKASVSALRELRSSSSASGSMMRWPGATMAQFAESLSSRLERQVVDKTGLTGRYAVELRWDSSQGQSSSDDPGRWPPLSVALEEQLGLRLTSDAQDLEVLVVDAARSSPTAN